MKYTVRGNKMEVTEAIKDYVMDKLSKLDKYFDNAEDVDAKIQFSVRGREQKVEVTINSSNYDLRAEVSHSDMYAAIDLAVDKLEGQIRKFKTKLMSREKVQMIYDDFIEDDEELEEIVRGKKVYLKPMDEEEAITQMELLGHTFFVFKNIDTNEVNVLYKRLDGAYGIIETN